MKNYILLFALSVVFFTSCEKVIDITNIRGGHGMVDEMDYAFLKVKNPGRPALLPTLISAS